MCAFVCVCVCVCVCTKHNIMCILAHLGSRKNPLEILFDIFSQFCACAPYSHYEEFDCHGCMTYNVNHKIFIEREWCVREYGECLQ